MNLADYIGSLVGLTLLAGSAITITRWGLPRFRERRDADRSMREFLTGTPEIPANPITGTRKVEARPSAGQMIAEIHHEMHPNKGSSMNDSVRRNEAAVTTLVADVVGLGDVVARILLRLQEGEHRFDLIDAEVAAVKTAIGVELHTANDAVANAAEASKVALSTIGDAIRATPPG